MDKRRLFLTSLILLVVGGSCVLLIRLPTLQESVREGLIMPVVYLVWLAQLLLRSVDQPVLWGAAMIILGFGLLYGLLSAWPGAETPLRWNRRSKRARVVPEEEQPPPVRGRVDYWEGKVISLRNQGMDSDYANFEFRRLSHSVAETIAGESGRAAAPDDIQVFLIPVDRSNAALAKQPVPWWKRFNFTRQPEPAPADDPLINLCTYLEGQLESKHDDVD